MAPPYNRIQMSIENGLKRATLGTMGGYIQLLESPPGANVRIHINEKNSDGIPLKNYHAIEADDIERVFVSADAVANGSIVFLQSSKQKFRLITPASDINVDEVGSYSDVALTALDKIFNRFLTPEFLSLNSSTNGTTQILNKLLDSDKIMLTPFFPSPYSIQVQEIGIYLDGEEAGSWLSFYNGQSYTAPSQQLIFEGVKGKTLSIYMNTQAGYKISCSLQEYTLKP